MTNKEYTYPVADASFSHADAVLSIDTVMNRLGFHRDGALVASPELKPVHEALDALYAAIESARQSFPIIILPDPMTVAVSIAREAAAGAGVLDELDDASDEDEDDDA